MWDRTMHRPLSLSKELTKRIFTQKREISFRVYEPTRGPMHAPLILTACSSLPSTSQCAFAQAYPTGTQLDGLLVRVAHGPLTW